MRLSSSVSLASWGRDFLSPVFSRRAVSVRRVVWAFAAARRRHPVGCLRVSPSGAGWFAPVGVCPPGSLVSVVSVSWPGPFGVCAWRGFLPWWASRGGRAARAFERAMF